MYNYFLCCRCVYCKTLCFYVQLALYDSQQRKKKRWCMSWIHLNTQINSHALTRLRFNSGPSDVIFRFFFYLFCATFSARSQTLSRFCAVSWMFFYNLVLRSLLCCFCFHLFRRMLSMIGAQILFRRKLTWKKKRERGKTSVAENIINGILQKHISIKGIHTHSHSRFRRENIKGNNKKKKVEMLRC